MQRRYPREDVEATLERLTELGYLDDQRATGEFVRSRMARGPIGPRRLRADLERRGAPGSSVEAALAEAFPDGDSTVAREAARRWRLRGGHDVAALARHLERKGFSSSSIARMVEELRSEVSDGSGH